MTMTTALQHFSQPHFEELARSENAKASTFSPAAVHVSFPDMLPSVCAKVFRSGAVHVTGCKCPLEFVCVVDTICGGRAYIDAFQVVMINVNVTFARALNIYEVAEEARRRRIFCEQPPRPPSVLLKNNNTTIMLYKTGKAVFTTKKDLSDMAAAYVFFMDLVVADPSKFFGEPAVSDLPHWTHLVHTGMPGLMHTHVPCRCLQKTCDLCTKLGNEFSLLQL